MGAVRTWVLVIPPTLLLLLAIVVLASGSEDLYAVLGVPRDASTKDIKSAYRRKALDTHPDKNKGVPAEEAAAEFHSVVHAFEVLSDPSSRRRYDTRGDDGGGGGSSSSRSRSDTRDFNFNQFFRNRHHQGGGRRRTVLLKDTFEVKQAQSRVLHVISLEQLRTIMLDDDDRLERHLLMCFYTPALEKVVDEEILYPYPFAGMSSQSIWWEDLLQTVSVRFRRANDLTRYFNVASGDHMQNPEFIFIKRGAVLGEVLELRPNTGEFAVYATNERESFENWMWSRMEVKVVFRNRHAHPVEIHWISGTSARLKDTVQPGSSWEHYSMLTHEFYARDARVDAWDGSPGKWKLSTNSCLGSWKIGQVGEGGSPPIRDDGSVHIDIGPSSCFDLSGHCGFWANQDQCNENPGFMREKCALTCGQCGENQRSHDEF